MRASNRARVEELFHRLIRMDDEARSGLLTRIRPTEPEVEAELRSLLVAYDAPGELDRITEEIAHDPIALPGSGQQAPSDMAGTAVGHYEIEDLIGRGGMGDVYRARDTKLGRPVALKFLPYWMCRDPSARDRFVVEARIVSALDHPNVCGLFELGETDDHRLFLVMPYYAGDTLKQRLKAGPLPAREAADIALQVARGLSAAHERGIVHRDVKPGNVLLTESGPVKILDFGVAKLTDLTLTQPGGTPGTAAYMSPEQRAGTRVDARSDLWSLGVILHEMLTGLRPTAEGGRRGPKFGDAPAGLRKIAKRLLADSPGRRYPSADEVVDDVKRWFRANARPTGISKWLSSRKHILPRGRMIGAVTLLGVIALLGSGWLIWRGAIPIASSHRLQDMAPRAVAVLPFVDLSEDGTGRAFAWGLQDDLTTQLSRIEALNVTSRESSTAFADTELPAREIARRLGVRNLIQGRIRTSGGRIKLNIWLTDAVTDEQLWSEVYDRAITAENVFAIQAEIAQAVAAALSAELSLATRAALAALPTQSIEAWNAYNRARAQADLAGHQLRNRWAAAEAETATRLDPSFLAAWTLLVRSRTWSIRGGDSFDTMPAFEALKRLRKLGPETPERYSAEGYYQYYARADFEAALEHLQTALTLRPGDRELAEFVAYVLRRLGRWEESLDLLEPIARADPRKYRVAWNQAMTYGALGRYEEAGRLYELALKLEPTREPARAFYVETKLFGEGDLEGARSIAERPPGFTDQSYVAVGRYWRRYFAGDFSGAVAAIKEAEGPALEIPLAAEDLQSEDRHVLMALALRMAGDVPEARRMADLGFEKALAELERRPDPDPVDRFGLSARVHSSAALALALRGGEGDVRGAVEHAETAVRLYGLDRDALDGALPEWTLARVYVLAGEYDRALSRLEEIYSKPGVLGPGALRLDPIWDPIRENPRFQAVQAASVTST